MAELGEISVALNLDTSKLANGISSASSEFTKLEKSGDAISKAFDGSFSKIGSTVKSAFSGVANTITSQFSGIGNKISSEFKSVTSSLSGIGKSISSAFSGVGSAVAKEFSGISGKVKDALSNVKSTVSSAFSGITSSVSNALSGVKGAVTSAFSGVTSSISSALSGVKNTISSAFSGVTSSISSALSGVKSTVSTAFSGISSSISSALSGVKGAISNAFSGVSGAISSSLSGVKSAVTGAFSGITSSISSALSGVKGAITSAFSGVSSSVNSSLSGIKTSITNAFSGVSSKISSAFSGVGKSLSSSLSGPIAEAKGKLTELSGSVDKVFNGLTANAQKVSGTLQIVGAAITAHLITPMLEFAKESTNAFMVFDDTMRKVQAVTDANGSQFQKLTDQARLLGATTSFNSQDAGEAMVFLGQAGFDSNQIYTAMPATLALARGSMTELATTADILTNIMSGFCLTAEDTARAADVLAKAANATNTDVTQLGVGMKYAAPLAKTVGWSLEETAGAMGLLSNAGIKADMAGTVLRGSITRLLSPTKKNAEMIESLGLAVDDLDPSFHSLAEILDTVKARGMSTGQIMQLFGQRAGPGMLALLNQGTDALRNMEQELLNSGGYAERAAEMMDAGWGGVMRNLENSVEAIQLSWGKSLTEMFEIPVKAITALILAISKIPAPVQKGLIAMGAFATVIGSVVVLVAAAGPLIMALGPAVKTIGTFFGIAELSVSGFVTTIAPIAGAIGLVVAALYLLESKTGIFSKTFDSLKDLAVIAADAIKKTWEDFTDWIETAFEKISTAFDNFSFSNAVDSIKETLNDIYDWVKKGIEDVVTLLKDIVPDNLGDSVTQILSDIKTGITDKVKEIWDEITAIVPDDWKSTLSDKFSSLSDSITETLSNLRESVTTKVKEIAESFVDLIPEDVKTKLSDGLTWLKDAITEKLSSMKDGLTTVVTEVGGALLKLLPDDLESKITDGLSSLKEKISETVKGMSDSFKELIPDDLSTSISDALSSLKDSISDTVSSFGDIFEGIIPENFSDTIKNWVQTDIKEPFQDLADSISEILGATTFDDFKEAVTDMKNWIVQELQEIKDAFSDIIPESFKTEVQNLKDYFSGAGEEDAYTLHDRADVIRSRDEREELQRENVKNQIERAKSTSKENYKLTHTASGESYAGMIQDSINSGVEEATEEAVSKGGSKSTGGGSKKGGKDEGKTIKETAFLIEETDVGSISSASPMRVQENNPLAKNADELNKGLKLADGNTLKLNKSGELTITTFDGVEKKVDDIKSSMDENNEATKAYDSSLKMIQKGIKLSSGNVLEMDENGKLVIRTADGVQKSIASIEKTTESSAAQTKTYASSVDQVKKGIELANGNMLTLDKSGKLVVQSADGIQKSFTSVKNLSAKNNEEAKKYASSVDMISKGIQLADGNTLKLNDSGQLVVKTAEGVEKTFTSVANSTNKSAQNTQQYGESFQQLQKGIQLADGNVLKLNSSNELVIQSANGITRSYEEIQKVSKETADLDSKYGSSIKEIQNGFDLADGSVIKFNSSGQASIETVDGITESVKKLNDQLTKTMSGKSATLSMDDLNKGVELADKQTLKFNDRGELIIEYEDENQQAIRDIGNKSLQTKDGKQIDIIGLPPSEETGEKRVKTLAEAKKENEDEVKYAEGPEGTAARWADMTGHVVIDMTDRPIPEDEYFNEDQQKRIKSGEWTAPIKTPKKHKVSSDEANDALISEEKEVIKTSVIKVNPELGAGSLRRPGKTETGQASVKRNDEFERGNRYKGDKIPKSESLDGYAMRNGEKVTYQDRLKQQDDEKKLEAGRPSSIDLRNRKDSGDRSWVSKLLFGGLVKDTQGRQPLAAGLKLPELKMPELPDLSDFTSKLSDISNFKLPDLSKLKMPELPDISNFTSRLTEISNLKLPDLSSFKLPDFSSIQLPDLSNIRSAFDGIASGISESLSGLPSTINSALGGIPSTISSTLSSIPSTISGALGGIGSTISSTLSGIPSTISSIFSGISSTVSSALSSVPTTVSSIFSGIVTTISSTLSNLPTTVSSVFTGISTSISSVQTTISTTVSNTWTQIQTTISNIITNISTTVQNTWNNIQTTISTILQTISTTVQNVWTQIQTAISTVLQTIFTTVQTIWNQIQTTISTVLQTILTESQNIWNQILTTITDILNNIYTTAQTTWNNIQTTISTTLNNIYTEVQNIWNQILTSISNIMNEISSTLSTKWEEAKTIVSNALTEMVNTITSKATDFYNAAVNIGQNIVDGLNSTKDEVISVINEITSLISDYLPHSPAKKGALSELPNWDAVLHDPLQQAINKIGELIPLLNSVLEKLTQAFPESGINLGLNTKDATTSLQKLNKEVKKSDAVKPKTQSLAKFLESKADVFNKKPAGAATQTALEAVSDSMYKELDKLEVVEDKSSELGYKFVDNYCKGMEKGQSEAVKTANTALKAINDEFKKQSEPKVQSLASLLDSKASIFDTKPAGEKTQKALEAVSDSMYKELGKIKVVADDSSELGYKLVSDLGKGITKGQTDAVKATNDALKAINNEVKKPPKVQSLADFLEGKADIFNTKPAGAATQKALENVSDSMYKELDKIKVVEDSSSELGYKLVSDLGKGMTKGQSEAVTAANKAIKAIDTELGKGGKSTIKTDTDNLKTNTGALKTNTSACTKNADIKSKLAKTPIAADKGEVSKLKKDTSALKTNTEACTKNLAAQRKIKKESTQSLADFLDSKANAFNKKPANAATQTALEAVTDSMYEELDKIKVAEDKSSEFGYKIVSGIGKGMTKGQKEAVKAANKAIKAIDSDVEKATKKTKPDTAKIKTDTKDLATKTDDTVKNVQNKPIPEPIKETSALETTKPEIQKESTPTTPPKKEKKKKKGKQFVFPEGISSVKQNTGKLTTSGYKPPEEPPKVDIKDTQKQPDYSSLWSNEDMQKLASEVTPGNKDLLSEQGLLSKISEILFGGAVKDTQGRQPVAAGFDISALTDKVPQIESFQKALEGLNDISLDGIGGKLSGVFDGISFDGAKEKIDGVISGITESFEGLSFDSIKEKLSEVFSGLTDSINLDSLSGINEKISEAIKGITDAVSGLSFDGITEKITGFTSSLTGISFDGISSQFQGFVTKISELPGQISSALSTLSSNIQSEISSMVSNVTSQVTEWGSAWDQFKTTVTTKSSEIVTEITNWISNLGTKWTEIQDSFQTLITNWQTKWDELKTSVSTKTTEIIDTVTTWITNLGTKYDEIVTELTTHITNWQTKLEELKTNITTKTNEIITDISTWITNLRTKFSEIVTELTTHITNWQTKLEELRTAVSTKTTEIINTITTWVQNLSTKFSELVTDIQNKFTEILNVFSNAVTEIQNKATEFYNAAAEVGQKVIDGLTDKLAGIKDTVAQMWQAVASAPSNAVNSAVNTAKDVGGKVGSAVTNAADEYVPHSPAKRGPFRRLPDWHSAFRDPILSSIRDFRLLDSPLSRIMARYRKGFLGRMPWKKLSLKFDKKSKINESKKSTSSTSSTDSSESSYSTSYAGEDDASSSLDEISRSGDSASMSLNNTASASDRTSSSLTNTASASANTSSGFDTATSSCNNMSNGLNTATTACNLANSAAQVLNTGLVGTQTACTNTTTATDATTASLNTEATACNAAATACNTTATGLNTATTACNNTKTATDAATTSLNTAATACNTANTATQTLTTGLTGTQTASTTCNTANQALTTGLNSAATACNSAATACNTTATGLNTAATACNGTTTASDTTTTSLTNTATACSTLTTNLTDTANTLNSLNFNTLIESLQAIITKMDEVVTAAQNMASQVQAAAEQAQAALNSVDSSGGNGNGGDTYNTTNNNVGTINNNGSDIASNNLNSALASNS